MSIRRASLSWAILIAGFPAVIASAQSGGHPIPEAERWATITHPGNQPYVIPPIHPKIPTPPPLGRVDYEFQIGRTEVTGAEWFEFVQAYAPYVNPLYADSELFTSRTISLIGPQTYQMPPLAANRPVEMGWHFAARYANWLHNDKALTAEAFESGAYDTSTFGPIGGPNNDDQLARSPGAWYWIPSQDEWVKSAHFDPNKDGPGLPGYWLYPTSSDTQPIGGPPELGGQTSAGYGNYYFENLIPEVAAYRDVQSPWGLWDVSGGSREWTESPEWQIPTSGAVRVVEGSSWRDGSAVAANNRDFIDFWQISRPGFTHGLRMARAVPGAWSAWAFVCAFSFALRKRRQNDETPDPSARTRVGLRVLDSRC
jgi:formylglycine-generating enzyme required for sulfatase activity